MHVLTRTARRLTFGPALLCAVAFLGPGAARAQSDASAAYGSDSAAVARHLFGEARRLMQEQAYAEACRKFEESQRLDPGGGTLLNLALCYELSGRTASAWAAFGEASFLARRDGRRDRQDFAEAHATALERRLSKLRVVVPSEARVPGLRVLRNGKDVGEPAWGEALPIDPGEQIIEASAPGRVAIILKVIVGQERDLQTAIVPRLERAAAATSQRTDLPAAPSIDARVLAAAPGAVPEASGAQRLSGLLVGGAGVVAVAIGTFFGVRAVNRKNSAERLCPSVQRCAPSSFSMSEQAVSDGQLSTAFVLGGAALVATGGVLVVTAPSAGRAGSARVSATLQF